MMKTELSLLKIAGILCTAGLVIASVAPNALKIPSAVRPWIFVFTIAWVLILVSGVFS